MTKAILTGLCSLSLALTGQAATDKPNIVFIVADDLGFSDLGCYGSEIHTPTLDSLAHSGMRFTQFYNGTRCCPSRASFLTGQYAHTAGIGHMTENRGLPAYQGDLSANVVTMAEVLKSSGYATGMTGKWHLTPHSKKGKSEHNWPNNRGFDYFFGTLPGHGSLWDPKGLFLNKEPIKAEKGFFYTDEIAAHSIKFIKQNAGQKPFFLYVPFTAPHYPLHAREETINKYEGVYSKGWDQLREDRFVGLKKTGILSAATKLSPRDPASIPWEDSPHKRWQAHRMQVFAAMIDEMDQAIGQIVTTLKETKQYDNTLIVFISDNGGSNEGHLYNTIERLEKPWTSSMFPEKTLDGYPVMPGDFPNLYLGPDNTYGSYGIRWASVSNTPFRRHKSWVHEGGISTPCIMHWPAKLKQQKTSKHISHIIDLMPTFVDAAQATYPKTFNGKTIPAMEGLSLLPLIEDKELSPRGIAWEHEGNRAYRKGKWKIVSEHPGSWKFFYPYKEEGKWELYDMENDRSELNNLATKHPEVLAELKADYDAWGKRVGVVPFAILERDHAVESTQ